MTLSATILVQQQADLVEPNRLSVDRLKSAAEQALICAETDEAVMVSLIIATDDTMQDMNHRYRGINAPTDVLAFPADLPPPPDQQNEPSPRYLGDVLIGLPYTARRVASEAHSLADEITLLVIHGTLHLLGYDHDTPTTQAEMWGIQACALDALGIDVVVPAYIHDDDG